MSAIDAALEMVAVVFLLAAMAYVMKLIQLTANAEIVALSKPKTVFRYMSFAFAALLLSPLMGLVFSTVAIYTALYFYRQAPEKSRPTVKNAEEIPN
jgi:hypothetical protein